jgi:hypothetical protein
MPGNQFHQRSRICAASALAVACLWFAFFVPALAGQAWDDSITAKHVRMRIPVERHWLGRESITDLERCWGFLQGAAGGGLPSRVLVVVEWEDEASVVDMTRGTISIGMSHPAAAKDPRGFLLHSAARELARMALISLSGGAISKDENRFLGEGMAEMLAHDFSNTTKKLGAAWAISYYLDRMNPLGLKRMSGRPELSGNHDLRSAAAGVTLLTVYRELYGRERVWRIFESLGKKSLENSLSLASGRAASLLETEWLKRVRSYIPADVTVSAEEDAPALDKVAFVPDQAKPGAAMAVQVFVRDSGKDLLPTGIFGVDESTGKVLQGLQAKSAGGSSAAFEIPIEAGPQPGRYRLLLTAVDEGGNVRNWEAFYTVIKPGMEIWTVSSTPLPARSPLSSWGWD